MKKDRKYRRLTWSDRLKIEAWMQVGVRPKEMAEKLGVHFVTIYRELKRGQYVRMKTDLTTEIRYSPDISEKKKQEYLRAKGPGLKIGNDREFASYIEYKISVEKYSPGAVLGEIKAKNIHFSTTITKPTLYRYIDQGLFLSITNKDLPVKRNKNKVKHKKVRAARAAAGDSIEKRPPEIETRERFGDWEMDSVIGKKESRTALLVLTERKTRQEMIRVLRGKTVRNVIAELDKIERSIGLARFRKIFRTITMDNGSEFADPDSIERSCTRPGKIRTKTYYCHPYSSCERGSNENQNRLVRRFFPKGQDLTRITDENVRAVQDWINEYPRAIFDYRSSADLFAASKEELCLTNVNIL